MTATGGGGPELDRVIAFIRSQIPPPRPEVITAETDLRVDLRMIWEDAEALMAAFFTTFAISPGDFEIARYFPREGSLLTSLVQSLRGHGSAKAEPLTVGMLAAALRGREWRSAELERR